MINRILLIAVVVVLSVALVKGQKYGGVGSDLVDYSMSNGVTEFPIVVDGLPDSIDCSFGLESVCIKITHDRLSDLKVTLLSPDGTEVWLTNRNGGESFRYIATCFKSDGLRGFINTAEPPYAGEFIPDGKMEAFNNGQNPNGEWKLLVEDLQPTGVGKLFYVNLYFGDEPNCNVVRCSYDTPEECVSSCRSGRMLPDIVLLPEITKSQYKLVCNDDYCEYKFSAAMANIGEGPLEIRRDLSQAVDTLFVDEHYHDYGIHPRDTFLKYRVHQFLYSIKGEETLSLDSFPGGTVYYDSKPGHDHYHMDDWAHFSILRKTKGKNPKRWEVIAKTEKISYCLFDTQTCIEKYENCTVDDVIYGQDNLPNFGAGIYMSCGKDRQGISVGSIDYYGYNYEGQSIRLPKNLDKGDYYLYSELDPKCYFLEKNRKNNRQLIPIDLSSLFF